MTTPDLFLFISHVSEDRAAAMEIVDELERRGVRCWVAPRNVSPGAHFDDAIADAIDGSRAMLLIFSERCNDSEYIRREVTVAGEAGKVIIPFRIENAQPKRGLRVRLSDLHWIDGFVSRERAIDELAKTFQQPGGAPPAPAAAGPTPASDAAPVPDPPTAAQERGAAEQAPPASTAEDDARRELADAAARRQAEAELQSRAAEAKRRAEELARVQAAQAFDAAKREDKKPVPAAPRKTGLSARARLIGAGVLVAGLIAAAFALDAYLWPVGPSPPSGVASGQLLHSFTMGGEVHAQYLRDGKRLVAGNHDGLMEILDADTGAVLNTLPQAPVLTAIAVAPDASRFAAGSYAGVNVFDASSGMLDRKLDSSTGHALSFSRDSAQLAASDYSQVNIWDVRTGKLVRKFGDVAITSLAYSPQADQAVTADDTRRLVKIWNTTTGQMIVDLSRCAASDGVGWLPDGKRIISTAINDATVAICDAQSGALVWRVSTQAGALRSAAVSPDGAWIATAQGDRNVMLWNAAGDLARVYRGHTNVVDTVGFSPDGKRIVSGSWDGTIKIWAMP